jgi:tetratricopeptide (TPR) repeat protein
MCGVFAKMVGEDDRAQELLESGVVELRRERPDSIALVNGLCHLAAMRADEGRTSEAIPLSDEAIETARRSGDPGSLAMALDLGAYVARSAGDHPRAIAISRAAVAESRGSDTFQLANALAGLAAALAEAGDLEASDVAWEAIAAAEAGGQTAQVAEVSMIAGEALAATNRDEAIARIVSAIATWLAIGVRPSAVQGLIALARIVGADRPTETTQLIGAIERRNRGRLPDELADFERQLREALGSRAFAEARTAGSRLDDDALSRLAASLGQPGAPRSQDATAAEIPA